MNASPRSAVVRFAQKARAKGVRGVCRSIAHRVRWDIVEWVREQYWEWKLGVSTTGDVPADALGLPDPDCHGYGPSRYGSLRKILNSMDIDSATDVFIDFGSGKGRVLVLAATYPFRRVIGVDPSAKLNDIARRNVSQARRWLRCPQVAVLSADAATYAIPDDATVLYFANPFSGRVLDQVLDNIRASLARAPRRIYLISHNHDVSYPCEQQIRSCSWLRVAAEISLQRNTRAWIYVAAG